MIIYVPTKITFIEVTIDQAFQRLIFKDFLEATTGTQIVQYNIYIFDIFKVIKCVNFIYIVIIYTTFLGHDRLFLKARQQTLIIVRLEHQ